MSKETEERIHKVQARLKEMGWYFSLDKKRNAVAALEKEAGQPGFWSDSSAAKKKSKELDGLKREVAVFEDLTRDLGDLEAHLELAQEAKDDKELAEVQAGMARLEKRLEDLDFRIKLSGEHDPSNAILSLHAGAGGTEAQDWAQMLLRMFSRWAGTKGFEFSVTDMTMGEEAGIKSVTAMVRGPYAYGYLKGEMGVHRLVRLSPYDPNHLRHTSFAEVEILPSAEEDPEIEVRPDDVKLDVFRSSGPGGQNVQKVASAVRLTHLPTGIIVTCQNERSQHQNREFAMRILKAKLLARKNEEKSLELAKLRGERVIPEWGNQIRSYVLHPYKSVKDHRTNFQSTNPEAVLNGNLGGFIEAYLMSRVGGQEA